MKTATKLVSFDPCPEDPFHPTATPLYQTATFAQESADRFGTYDYSRSGNPTRDVLEARLAELEAGDGEGVYESAAPSSSAFAPAPSPVRALAYTSGLAALAGVLRLVPAGGRVVVGDDLYGGTFRLLDCAAAAAGTEVARVDTGDLAAVRRALAPGADLVLVETPSNPRQRVTDLAAVGRLARGSGALFAVDGTMLSPLLQRPLALGADLVVHSATKFLSGHSDLTAGVAATARPELAERLAFLRNAEGTALAPFEAWLLLRGLKTLAVRLERQQATAGRLARFLAAHPRVREVYWVGLPGHPGKAVHDAQADGPGSVISFTTGDDDLSRRLVETTRLFTTAVSFGGVGSSISLPYAMSHASIPEAQRREAPLPRDLVRISTGLEAPEDLLLDLGAALAGAAVQPLSGRVSRG